MKQTYPLASSSWDTNEYNAIQSVVNSGVFTMGEYVSEFEIKFSEFIGSKYSVMVNSGSSANLLMTAALFYTKNEIKKLKRGDEVIVPAVSWGTSFFPLYQYGLKLKFVDIDLYSLNYDLNSLSRAVTENTKLILLVNLLGNPNNFSEIKKIVDNRDIIIIEDNCESLGAKYNNKYTGTFGLMGSFSTFFSHHISTMEGGIIVTDNEEIYHILLSLRAHGWTRNLPKHNYVSGIKENDPFLESFKFVLPGYNVRPLELSGAIGIEQLKKLPNLITERRKNAALWSDMFINHPNFIIQKEIDCSSWFGFSLIIRPGSSVKRIDLINYLSKNGIECRPVVAGNFVKNDAIKYFDYEIFESLKNADYIDLNGLFIGNQHFPIEDAFKIIKLFN
jgi:CDP-6-deoxy-D-xylo-4-hexulose-3-dehydrase